MNNLVLKLINRLVRKMINYYVPHLNQKFELNIEQERIKVLKTSQIYKILVRK